MHNRSFSTKQNELYSHGGDAGFFKAEDIRQAIIHTAVPILCFESVNDRGTRFQLGPGFLLPQPSICPRCNQFYTWKQKQQKLNGYNGYNEKSKPGELPQTPQSHPLLGDLDK